MPLAQGLRVCGFPKSLPGPPGAFPRPSRTVLPRGGRAGLLVIVGEPGIRRHPQGQRRTLEPSQRLAGEGRCQVVYSTRSPMLVDLRGPLGLRRITRDGGLNMAPIPAREVDPALQQMRLSRHVAEGAFSHGAMLVGDPHGEAMLTAVLSVTGDRGGKGALRELAEASASIVVCGGIGNVPHSALLFRAIGMPAFAVWDADGHGSGRRLNGEILGLLGQDVRSGGGQEHDSCHAGHNCLCFPLDACLYLKGRPGFGGREPDENTGEEIKGPITTYEGLAPKFDTDQFRGSGFATNVVPRMRDRFLRK